MLNAIQPVVDRIQITRDQVKVEAKEKAPEVNVNEIISPYCFCQTNYGTLPFKMPPKRKYRPL